MCMLHRLMYVHSFMAHIILVIWSITFVHIIVSCVILQMLTVCPHGRSSCIGSSVVVITAPYVLQSKASHLVLYLVRLLHLCTSSLSTCSTLHYTCTPVHYLHAAHYTTPVHQFTIYMQHITLHLYTSSLPTYSTLHYTCTPVHYLHAAHYTTHVHQFTIYIRTAHYTTHVHQFTIYMQHITLHMYTSSLSTYSTLPALCTYIYSMYLECILVYVCTYVLCNVQYMPCVHSCVPSTYTYVLYIRTTQF